MTYGFILTLLMLLATPASPQAVEELRPFPEDLPSRFGVVGLRADAVDETLHVSKVRLYSPAASDIGGFTSSSYCILSALKTNSRHPLMLRSSIGRVGRYRRAESGPEISLRCGRSELRHSLHCVEFKI